MANEPPPAAPSLLEQWSDNERMRHVPSVQWMIDKLDRDVRRWIEKLSDPFLFLASADPRYATIEAGFADICRAFDRLSDAARHVKAAPHPPSDIGSRIPWSLSNAILSLRTIDASLFGRRYPFHSSERSRAEAVWGAFLIVLNRIDSLIPLIREIDPEIDERLCEGLVRFEEPMSREPIA